MNNIMKNKKLFLLLNIITFFSLLRSTKTEIPKPRNLQGESLVEYFIKLNGIGNQYIFSYKYYLYGGNNPKLPDRVLINNEETSVSNEGKCNVNNEINNVTLIWSNPISPITFLNMFRDINNIIEINFTRIISCEELKTAQMFRGLTSLKYANVSILFGENTNVDQSYQMFFGCTSLLSVDLSGAHTSKIKNFNDMFCDCHSLVSLDLSDFDTSSALHMKSMFYNCASLTSIKLNFKTENVQVMEHMFYGCTSLKSLDLSSFKTDSLISMKNMFDNCYSLENLDISNFNTEKIETLESLFNNCKSLKNLDISNLDTSKVKNMNNMFSGCNSLISIDLSNFNTNNVEYMNNMFKDCSSLNSLNLLGFNTQKVLAMESMFNGCNSLKLLNLSNFNSEKVETMENMFKNCNNLKVLDLSNFYTSNVRNVDNMFAGCEKLIYLKLYPYDGKEIFYNLDHYKTICTDDFEKLKDICPNLDNDYTVNNCSIFPFQYNTSDDNSIIISFSSKPKNEIFDDLDYLLYNSDSFVIYGDDYLVVVKPIDQIIEESSVNIDFTNCEKILKKFNPDYKFRIVQINLRNNNEGFLTDQVEYKVYNQFGEEMDLSICKDVKIMIEYALKNSSSLNIEKIKSYKNKGIDILNINDDFFNDICFPFSDSDSDSDVILNDRVTDIYYNYSLCDKGCEYQSFDIEKMCVYCSCEVKEEVSYELNKGNFKTYVKNNFFKSNFGVIKCYNLVFGIKRKLKNVAFWVFLIMTILHIPTYYFYFVNGINPISKYINDEMTKKGYNDKEITSSSKRINLNKNKKGNNLRSKRPSRFLKLNINNNPPKKEKEFLYFPNAKNNNGNFVKINRNIQKNDILKIINEDIISETDINDEYDINENIKKLKIEETTTEYNDEDKKDRKDLPKNSKKNAKKFRRFSVLTNSNLLSELSSKEVLDINSKNTKARQRKSIVITKPSKFSKNVNLPRSKSKSKSKSENEGHIDDKQKEMKELPLILLHANNTEELKPIKSDYLLNNFDYEEAIVHDKRNIFRIFFILLISKEKILNLIYFNPPLELRPLRICLFIFTYACDLALNALFYLTDNISDKYHYKGVHILFFSLINNLVVSFVSAVATFILLFFLQNLTHSTNKVEELFREQDNLLKNDKKYIVKEITKMEIKNKIKKIMKCLKIKIILFIVFELLSMIFFFYYTTAFCHVYESTQISWIIDSVASFGMSIITLIGISIISCILYKLSISFKIKVLYRIIMFSYSTG